MRITAAAPAAMLDDSNSLAMCLAYGPSDGNTYGPLNWQDAEGNLYAAASWEAGQGWVTEAQSTLVRPEWDVEPYVVNMAGARRAQAALVFWVPSEEEPDAPRASTAALTAIGGVDGLEALAMMGLTMVDEGLA